MSPLDPMKMKIRIPGQSAIWTDKGEIEEVSLSLGEGNKIDICCIDGVFKISSGFGKVKVELESFGSSSTVVKVE